MKGLRALIDCNRKNPDARITDILGRLEVHFYGVNPTKTPYNLPWGDYERIKSHLGIDLREVMTSKSAVKRFKIGRDQSYIILSYKNYVTHLCFDEFIEELKPRKNRSLTKMPKQEFEISIIKKRVLIDDFASIRPDNCLFIDTETTGLGKSDHVIELGIVDHNENIVFDSLLAPKRKRKIHPKAQEAHGISINDLAGKPKLVNVQSEIERLLKDKYAVFYNADFDVKKMLHGADGNIFKGCKGVICFMRLYADGKGRWCKLTKACEQVGVEFTDVPNHRASGDSIKLARLYRKWYDQQNTLINYS